MNLEIKKEPRPIPSRNLLVNLANRSTSANPETKQYPPPSTSAYSTEPQSRPSNKNPNEPDQPSSPVNYQPPMCGELPVCNGDRGKARSFLEEVLWFTKLNNCSLDHAAKHIIPSCLIEGAGVWFSAQYARFGDFQTWESFEEAFLLAFGEYGYNERIARLISSAQQFPDEQIMHYVNHVEFLYTRLERQVEDKEIIGKAIAGMLSPGQAYFKTQPFPESMVQFRQEVVKFELEEKARARQRKCASSRAESVL